MSISKKRRAYIGSFFISVLVSTSVARGDVNEIWSFEALVQHSDVIVIATFHAWRTIAFDSEDERRGGVYASNELTPLPENCVARDAVFLIKRVVKGKLTVRELNVLLYGYRDENVKSEGSRRFFPAELTQATGSRTLMLFLSRSADGHFFPTTGQSNTLDSVYVVEPFEEWRRESRVCKGQTPLRDGVGVGSE